MKKKLPNIFVNKIDKKICNNETMYCSFNSNTDNIEVVEDKIDIDEKIKSLFNSPNYVYKIATTITLNDGRKLEKNIIGKTSGKLITIDEELIDIKNIKDIEL